jgi:hypothetical protein
MAYIPTECTLEQYENQIYSGESKHVLYIKHGDIVIGTEAEDFASPFASSLTWTRRLLKHGSKTFSLSNFVSQEIDMTLHDYVIENVRDDIEIKIGTYIEEIQQYVYVPLGVYRVETAPTTDKGKTTYKLKDKSINFDFNYNAKPLIDSSNKTDENGNRYVTKLDILLDICKQAKIEYVGVQDFLGYDDKIGIYDNTISGRVYISYIFEQAGRIAYLNREGKLDSVLINNDLQHREISEDIVESFQNGKIYNISKVVYESGTILFENGTNDNDTLFINGANPYITNQEQIDNIGNSIIGFNINSFKTGKVFGNPTIDPFDIIVLNYENNEYKTLAQYVFTFNGVMTSKYETNIEVIASETNNSKNNDSVFKKSIRQEINNLDASLKIVAETIEGAETFTLSEDTQYQPNKEYYKFENNEYVLLKVGEDYNVGDNIVGNVYDYNFEEGLEEKVLRNEFNIDSQKTTIDIISTNINTENGDIESVKTTTGYTLDKDGLKIKKDINDYNSLHDNTGSYYKDGDTILSQTTKDGTITKDMVLYGKYYYGVREDLDVANFKKDDAMFVAELYTDNNGEEGFGHFYNGGDM